MMKRIGNWTIIIFVCLAFMFFLIGCGSTSNINDLTEASMKDYYVKEDFESIIIGESTHNDVYNIAHTKLMTVTSYGGFCEYPTQNGGCIRIKFYGKDLIVGAIEEVSQPPEIDNESSNTEQTSETSSNQQNYMSGYCSKDNVADFMSVLDEHELGGLSTGFVLDEEHCYNVTPDRVAEETSAQIFKFSDSCATFIYLDGQIYPFGEWFGGYGFVSAVPCDFDNDGNADILYTYSWGSGLHRSLVAVFNTQTMESTVIYDSSDTDNPQVDLYVSTQSPSIEIPNTEITTYFVVYSVDIEVLEDNFANLGCVVTGIAGSVESENGSPVFHTSTYNTEIGDYWGGEFSTVEDGKNLNPIVNIVDPTKTEGLTYDTAEEKFFESETKSPNYPLAEDENTRIFEAMASWSKVLDEDLLDDITLTVYCISPNILVRAPISAEQLSEFHGVEKIMISYQILKEHFDLLKRLSSDEMTPMLDENQYIDARIHFLFESKSEGKLLEIVNGSDFECYFINGVCVKYNSVFGDLIRTFVIPNLDNLDNERLRESYEDVLAGLDSKLK